VENRPRNKKNRLEIGPEYSKMFPKPEKPETYNSYWAGPLDRRGVRQVEIHHSERRLGITGGAVLCCGLGQKTWDAIGEEEREHGPNFMKGIV
jgi:hypothetical protein